MGCDPPVLLVSDVAYHDGRAGGSFYLEDTMRFYDMPQSWWGRKEWDTWVWFPLRRIPKELNAGFIYRQQALAFVSSAVENFDYRARVFREVHKMAGKKQREAWQTEWVHVDMTPEQKGEYRAWDFETEDVVEALGGFLSGGYKLTCNYNTSNSTFQASLICNAEKETNSGRGVSGYAATLWDAIRVAVYKVVVILPDDWADYKAPGGNDIG